MAPPRRVVLRGACALVLGAVGGNALSLAHTSRVGHYDFGYAIRGDKAARPAQVFDDGAGKVYFAPRPGQAMPAVFVGREPELLVLQAEGQYFTAHTGANEFMLALAGARASVRRGDAALGAESLSEPEPSSPALPESSAAERAAGSRLLASAAPGLPSGVDFGAADSLRFFGAADSSRLPPAASAHRVSHAQPVVFPAGSAVLGPQLLDALSALVLRIGHEAAIVVEGRNDAGAHDTLARLRGEALRNALLARGVAATRLEIDTAGVDDSAGSAGLRPVSTIRWTSVLTLPASLPGTSAGAAFDIVHTDGDIAVSLRRWAQASGYEIVWDTRWRAPVDGDLRIEAPSFLAAVAQVVAGLRAQGYPVQARLEHERVVRFTASR